MKLLISTIILLFTKIKTRDIIWANSNQRIGSHNSLSYPDFNNGGPSHSHQNPNKNPSHDHGHPIALNAQYPNTHDPSDHTHTSHKHNNYPNTHESDHTHSEHKHDNYPNTHRHQSEEHRFDQANNNTETHSHSNNSQMRQSGRNQGSYLRNVPGNRGMERSSDFRGDGMGNQRGDSNSVYVNRKGGSYRMAERSVGGNSVMGMVGGSGGSRAGKVGVMAGPDFSGQVQMGNSMATQIGIGEPDMGGQERQPGIFGRLRDRLRSRNRDGGVMN